MTSSPKPPETLRVTTMPTDAERLAISRRMRKFHTPAVRRRYRLMAIGLWLLTAGIMVLFFRYFDVAQQFMRDACMDHLHSLILEVDSDAENEYGHWLLSECVAESDQAREALRNAILCLLGFVVAYISYFFYWQANRPRAVFHPLNGRTFDYTISAQGFTSEEPGMGKSIYQWRGIERIERDGDMLLFFIDKCAAHFINLRHFASESEAEHFLAKARQWKAASDAIQAPGTAAPSHTP